jgi:hypothetical protein
MTAWTAGEDGIRWRRRDATTVEYLPTEPAPECDAQGVPQVTVVQAGELAFVTVGARWDPPAEALERLRDRLAADAGAAPRLAPPALDMEGAELLLGDEVIATSSTSGIAPYTAAFSATVEGNAGERAGAALRGERGRLAVRYRARLEGRDMELQADVGDWTRAARTETNEPTTGG